MKYLCQVWFDGTVLDTMTKEEKHRLDSDSLGYDRDLTASGHMIHAEALQSPRSAVTVRVRNGETSVTDGPFIETKEYLGGFILIEAKDLNDAIRVAAGIPLAKLGSIEVRPIHSFGPDA
ncbi:YciI family protein [Rhizobium lusitanum]|uniref:YciI family protein n=1 Tax=Rhizobium lusitanum TaxID=293958 RepID=A0A6L9UFL8_9HYPH|nr:YciI family protein [Rhizobium lusitanum]NEI74765.1 YciI family protein [Rhizobium lusitanum]